MKKNILSAAGLYKDDASIEEVYSAKVVEKVIELENGSLTNIDPKTFDLRKAEQHPEKSVKIQNDIAGLGRRAKQSNIYLIKGDNGIDGVILPIKSQGLWALMYGFLALEKDGVTVKGFQYYSQGETPGLGAEVDNPKWKSLWVGKKVYNVDFKPEISLVKTSIDPSSEMAKHQIDALSGATITTNGVQNSLRYWLSEDGYGKFLAQYRQGVQL
jgi:Na+-transporting NADH:ubiquinone oxidoreductase subunit C